ncbi:hypothetical protein C3941_07650 [Kaistia algarum]|uniref:HEPN domain-containing protein n=1 Tax=Kaistia algarum TaxID=2083279 RepID=UPI000CE8E6E3|nr:HEPN domain-containing protein [Kaistia algarum]MCX5511932.1 HEPN domain-containing protein [Kaistia algarum]PPE80063.1 hypothetical protein C3941_07650 [Kaistia algarum]
MKAMKDPPKKKHANRPRKEPLSPLSDAERLVRARQEFGKATVFVTEAEKLAVRRDTPNACAHAAYYAMNHCALAAVLASGGIGRINSAPQNHRDTIFHFAALVEGESEELRECGKALNGAFSAREIADYGMDASISADDAAQVASDATRFIRACRERWSLDKL